MAKDKVTMTIDPWVLADTDADAEAAGYNRSEYVERVLRDAHYARLLAQMPPRAPMAADEEAHLRAVMDWQRDASLPTPTAPGQAAA